MTARALVAATALAATASACSSDGGTAPPEPETLLTFGGAQPGQIVGVAADDERGVVSWLHRTDGTVHELVLPDDGTPEPDEATIVASLPVGTDSSQGGLLDQVFVPGGERVLTWVTAEGGELVLGTLGTDPGAEPTVLWSAGPVGNGAIGGTLDLADDGTVLLSVGRNTAWDDARDTDGAILRFDLGAAAEPAVVSTGYTNPWAIESVTAADGSDEVWVWDNAAGPDPEDPDAEDVERLGRADRFDRSGLVRSDRPDRAPAAMVELGDGRLGVCGFLDNELRAYDVADGADGPRTALERAGTIMACNTAAAVFEDGTIVTAAQTTDGESLQILRP